ncbi:MAG: sorbosone dehydrogenase family protein [Rhodospirillaceae bacterium]|nr:sorbosone dehydrogenase family protein [Rhodospirillaceae bacterium]
MRMMTSAIALMMGVAAIGVMVSGAMAQTFEQAPGTKIKIDAATMPQPYSPPSPANPSRNVPRPTGAMPTVPAGFKVNIFAEGLGDARNLLVAPNGDVFVAEQDNGKISILRDGDGDGKAEKIETFAEGFRGPFGLDFVKDGVLVGDTVAVWRLAYRAGDMKATGRQQLTKDGAIGDPAGHSTRAVAMHPDGSKFYVSIGSRGNINEEPEPRATIQEFKFDGKTGLAVGQRTFATGLRNAVGTAFYPGTGDLYTVVNERDGLGDELVPDYLTKVKDGGFYGWPYSYIGKNPQRDPGGNPARDFASKRPDLVEKATVPDTLFRSHSAPVGLAFSTGKMFPKEYQGGAFVGLHGSWNAAQARGYHVVYVPFENGKPADHYIVFVSGFWTAGEKKAETWGRPAGVAVAKDGALLVADDVGNMVWRVSAAK